MIVELTTTNIEIIPELNAVNLVITPTFTSGSGGGGGGHIIEDNGTPLPQRSKLNIIGATLEDDEVNDATKLTIPSGGLIDSISFDGVEIAPIAKNVELSGVVAKQGTSISTSFGTTVDVELSKFADGAGNDKDGNDITDTYATKTELDSKQSLNTGYIDGMVLSINTDTTKFNIAAGHYVISDNNSLAPTATIKTFAGLTAQPIVSMAANATYIALDSNMAIVQQAQPFSDIQRRTLCLIGAAIHSNHTVINVVNEIKAPITGDVNQLHDFIKAVGALNLSGNVYGSTSGMLLNKSAGVIFALGINASNPLDPHQITIPLQTGLTFRYRLQNSTEYVDRTTIDPLNYDLNGVLTPIPGTKYTVQHINLFQSGLTRIQYGQKVYANFDEAKANFEIDPFVVETNMADNAVFRAYLILKESATNLATEITAGRAMFIPVDKFGNVISGGAAALTYDSIVAALTYIPASPTDLALKIDKTQNQITKDPTGFHNPELVVVTGNLDRTITLTGTVAASYRGELMPTLVSGYVSPIHGTVTTDMYYLSYDGISIAWRNTPWTFDSLQIAIAKYNVTNLEWKYYREVHGLMGWQTHQELHETVGTYKSAGGTIPSASYVLLSTTATDRRPNIDQTIIKDEDLPSTLAALTSKLYTQFSLTGAAIESNVLGAADIVPLLALNPYYNTFATPNWGQTLMPTNSVATVWIYAQPMAMGKSQDYRFIFVQPQWITQATSQSAGAIAIAVNTEKLRTPSELNLNGLLTTEIVAIGRIIIAYTGANWSLRDVSLLSGTKLGQIASPSGNFLSVVEHDATLAGAGTAASPLGTNASLIPYLNNQILVNTTTDIIPDFSQDIWRTSNTQSVAETAVSNSTYLNLPIFTCFKTGRVYNAFTATRTLTLRTTDLVLGGITYTFQYINSSVIAIPTLKMLEISYEFIFTSATTCTVSIISALQS